jgi:hypothetical protein
MELSFSAEDRKKDVVDPDGNRIGEIIDIGDRGAYVELDEDARPSDAPADEWRDPQEALGDDIANRGGTDGDIFVLEPSNVKEISGEWVMLQRWPPW